MLLGTILKTRVNEVKVTDMTPGERYTVQVNTGSHGVEGLHPLNVTHTTRKHNKNVFENK